MLLQHTCFINMESYCIKYIDNINIVHFAHTHVTFGMKAALGLGCFSKNINKVTKGFNIFNIFMDLYLLYSVFNIFSQNVGAIKANKLTRSEGLVGIKTSTS